MTAEALALRGLAPDAELAERFGRTEQATLVNERKLTFCPEGRHPVPFIPERALRPRRSQGAGRYERNGQARRSESRSDLDQKVDRSGPGASPSTTEGDGLDKRGRFAPGNKIAVGNPFGRRVARLRATLVEAVTEDDMRQLATKLLGMAKAGDLEHPNPGGGTSGCRVHGLHPRH